MDQIIKFGISNYLQLCVEAGFSQIQSHIYIIIYFHKITNFLANYNCHKLDWKSTKYVAKVSQYVVATMQYS